MRWATRCHSSSLTRLLQPRGRIVDARVSLHWQAVSSLAKKVAVHSRQTADAVTFSCGTSTRRVGFDSQFGWGQCERTSRCRRPSPTHHGDYHVKLSEFNSQFGRTLRELLLFCPSARLWTHVCSLLRGTRGFRHRCVSLLRGKTKSTRQTS